VIVSRNKNSPPMPEMLSTYGAHCYRAFSFPRLWHNKLERLTNEDVLHTSSIFSSKAEKTHSLREKDFARTELFPSAQRSSLLQRTVSSSVFSLQIQKELIKLA
jgi:hypothetical protein